MRDLLVGLVAAAGLLSLALSTPPPEEQCPPEVEVWDLELQSMTIDGEPIKEGQYYRDAPQVSTTGGSFRIENYTEFYTEWLPLDEGQGWGGAGAEDQ